MENRKLSFEVIKNKDRFVKKISMQIREGQELASLNIGSERDLKRAMGEEKNWSENNRTLLFQIFHGSKIKREYRDENGNKLPEKPALNDYVRILKDEVKVKTGMLEEVLEIINSDSSRY